MVKVKIVFKSGGELVVTIPNWGKVSDFLDSMVAGQPFVYIGTFINPAEVAGATEIEE